MFQIEVGTGKNQMIPEYGQFLQEFGTSRPSQQSIDLLNNNGLFQHFPREIFKELIHQDLQKRRTHYFSLSHAKPKPLSMWRV